LYTYKCFSNNFITRGGTICFAGNRLKCIYGIDKTGEAQEIIRTNPDGAFF